MGFLRVAKLIIRDKDEALQLLGVALLLLCIERSLLRWFGHLTRMLSGCICRPKFCWTSYIPYLLWSGNTSRGDG